MPNSELSKNSQAGKLQITLRMKRNAQLEDHINSGYQQPSFPATASEAIEDAKRLRDEQNSHND